MSGNSPDDLLEVATSRGRVGDQKTDSLLGVNDEDGTDLNIGLADTLIKGHKITRTVKGRPLASRLVASCSSSMSYKVEILRSASAIFYLYEGPELMQ